MIELYRGVLPDGSKRTIWFSVNKSGVSMDAQDLNSVPEPFDEYEWGVSVSPDDHRRLLIDCLVEARGSGTSAEMSEELGPRSDADVAALLSPILVAQYSGQVDAVEKFRERLKSLGIVDHFWLYY